MKQWEGWKEKTLIGCCLKQRKKKKEKRSNHWASGEIKVNQEQMVKQSKMSTQINKREWKDRQGKIRKLKVWSKAR